MDKTRSADISPMRRALNSQCLNDQKEYLQNKASTKGVASETDTLLPFITAAVMKPWSLCLQPLVPRSVGMARITPPQVQNLALASVKFHIFILLICICLVGVLGVG